MDEIMGSADKAGRKRSEMSLAEIYEQVRTAKDRTGYVWWSLEFYQRLAFPAACLLLGLLGPPLGSLFRQKGPNDGNYARDNNFSCLLRYALRRQWTSVRK